MPASYEAMRVPKEAARGRQKTWVFKKGMVIRMSKKSDCGENVCKFKSKIGGQALIEGVMMKGIDTEAMAVRLPNGEIDLEQWKLPKQKWYNKTPFVRGPVNFVNTLIDGYRCISKSADKSMQGIEEEPTKLELWFKEKFGKKDENGNPIKKEKPISDAVMAVAMVFSSIMGVLLAVGLFILLPMLVTKGLTAVFPKLEGMYFVKNIIEGVMKIAIFILYIWMTSLLKDIRRTYEYHGAEHKTIFCYENGLEMTVENVRKQKRFHPRCGTSFMFIVMIISILVTSIFRIPWDIVWLRVLLKLCILPIIVGISYEIIKLAGRYDNIFTRIVSAPGLWIQRITTREPDDSQIEVAIAAFMPCIPEDKEQDRW